MNNIRDKFEAWYQTQFSEIVDFSLFAPTSAYYKDDDIDEAWDVWQAATEQSQKEIAEKDARIAELEACLHEIVNKSFTTYKAKNGKEVGIEDDAGEMCYIVPHEPIISAEHLVKSKTSELMVKVLHLAKDEMSKYKKG